MSLDMSQDSFGALGAGGRNSNYKRDQSLSYKNNLKTIAIFFSEHYKQPRSIFIRNAMLEPDAGNAWFATLIQTVINI